MGYMSRGVEANRPVGRRRDPRIEPLVMKAAIQIYAVQGWQGFTFDAVARASGVGKPAIYRRWSSREHLLVNAFDGVSFPTAGDRGSLRDDLEDYATQWADWYRSPYLPLAGSRVLLDCKSNPVLDRLYHDVITGPRGVAARQLTRRAIHRGELPHGTSVTVIPELLLGSMFMHWAFSIGEERDQSSSHLNRYAENLVEMILAGLHATPSGQ